MDELFGCWREASRCDKVATQLLRIRDSNPDFWDHITALLREVGSASRLLRDLYDLFPIYRSRVPVVLNYIAVLLPCLCRTLRDMLIYVDNDSLAPRAQWALLNERMGEQGGTTLAARFVMYLQDRSSKVDHRH